jgi:hypothetical protein
MFAQRGEIPGRIGIPLLAVEPGDEAGIEMLSTGVRKLVDHPRPGHPPILTSPPVTPAPHYRRFAAQRAVPDQGILRPTLGSG